MRILNATQHTATPDQVAEGIIDFPANYQAALKAAITFPAVYGKEELKAAARMVAELVRDFVGEFGKIDGVMIGGMPSFMPVLEVQLSSAGFAPCYAQSDRVVEEQTQADGSVRKVAVFKHAGLYFAT